MIAAEAAVADYASYPIHHRIERVGLRDGAVDVTWDDGRDSRFHFLWLRDNCPCPRCVNPKTREQCLHSLSPPSVLLDRRVNIRRLTVLHDSSHTYSQVSGSSGSNHPR